LTHRRPRIVPGLVNLALVVLAVGCSARGVPAVSSNTSIYSDPHEAGRVSGAGMEAQDLHAMTDRIARDMLASPAVSSLTRPAYVIVDDEYFRNESTIRINRRMITERLMVELTRAAQGRMFFVERQADDMVREERERKRLGETGGGSRTATEQVAGADFRLTGSIQSLDASDPSGALSRHCQVVFKLVDLESGLAAWTNLYEFQKNVLSDDVQYQ
jgi:penicillin-binding protein activator